MAAEPVHESGAGAVVLGSTSEQLGQPGVWHAASGARPPAGCSLPHVLNSLTGSIMTQNSSRHGI